MRTIGTGPVFVNDVHSRLNGTRVRGIVTPRTVDDLRTAVLEAAAGGRPVAVAGGRHAMGGQQFVQDALLIDVRGLDRPLAFDPHLGHVTVEAGIQWPALLAHLQQVQRGQDRQWGIYQKQTGADHLTLGGALACNAHGRGLTLGPIIQQVDAFDLLGPDGRIRTCSRTRHADLFRLAIGGYGLFGIVTTVRLRLRPRVKVRRDVEVDDVGGIIERLEDRVRAGYLYGDFQFAIDDARRRLSLARHLRVLSARGRRHPSHLGPDRLHARGLGASDVRRPSAQAARVREVRTDVPRRRPDRSTGMTRSWRQGTWTTTTWRSIVR